MYLTREEVTVAPGKLVQFEDGIARYFALLRQQSGLLRATLLNSRGYPGRYTTLEQWERPEDARAFARSAALAHLLREGPREGIATPSRPLEAYEVVHRVVGAGKPVAAYLIDEVVAAGPGNLQEFEDSRGEVYRLRQQFGPGFAVSLLSRFLGGANRYLIFGAFSSPGDDERTAATLEIQQFWEAHPSAQKLVTSAVRDPQELVAFARPEPI